MSLNLLKLFVNIGTVKFLGLPLRSGIQKRFIATMDIAAEDKPNNEIRSKEGTRYRKRQRNWEDNSNITEDEIKEKKLCDENGDKIKRKKMAMLLGYCGMDYSGMQRNPGVRTIEEDLLKALLEANYVTQDNFDNQQNAQFQRSSRTDKGVSAARQVVSLKMPVNSSIEEINKRLPECIKVFGIKRVTNKFNSKVKCSARTYSYTAPTYVFDANLLTEDERKSYRITPEKLEEINRVLSMYKGTKNYHNFTEKKFFQDPSSRRYMYSFAVDKVFVESDMEFAMLLVKGQSFMLHQIRKMVGLTIAVLRNHTEFATIEKAFSKEKVLIPTAPGLGLVLDMVHYDRYDAKYKNSHETLTWEECEDSVQKFKHQQIYPSIIKGEVEGNSMGFWLVEKLNRHHYEIIEEEKFTENEDNTTDNSDENSSAKTEEFISKDKSEQEITDNDGNIINEKYEKLDNFAEKNEENISKKKSEPEITEYEGDTIDEKCDKLEISTEISAKNVSKEKSEHEIESSRFKTSVR